MPFHVSFFLSQQGDRLGGWSENFWSNLPNISAVATEAAIVTGLLQATKGQQTFLTGVRVSDADKFRTVQILSVAPLSLSTLAIQTESDYQVVAAQVRLSATAGASTNQWFKGNPDNCVTTGGRWSPSALWLTAFGALMGRLGTTANGWCLRKLDPANLKYAIIAIGSTGILTVAPVPYTVGSVVKIRVSRVGGFAINALWNANVLSNTSLQLIGYVPPTVTPVYTGGKGTVQLQSFAYTAIATGKVIRASSHKTGRPFGQLTGRRKTHLKLGAG